MPALPPAPTPDVAGDASEIVADRYRVLGRIGRGGMAMVYLAQDMQLRREVALKVLRPRRLRQQTQKERFLNEGRTVFRIQHPNVVEVLDWGETAKGRVYLAMEYLKGEPLRRFLLRKHVLPWREAAPILLQICSAMHAAHEAGVVHRDLKPANVLLIERDGRKDFVKVLDFGLSKLAGGRKLTKTGIVVGTPAFLAPEQIQGKPVDARTDVYALGAILYRMLCGQMPFSSHNVMTMLRMQLDKLPKPPHEVNPSAPIPPDAEAIALRALSKNPDERFASMQHMAESIAAVAPDPAPRAAEAPSPPARRDLTPPLLPTPTPPPLGTTSLPAKSVDPAVTAKVASIPEARKRWPLWLGIATTVAVIAAAALVWFT